MNDPFPRSVTVSSRWQALMAALTVTACSLLAAGAAEANAPVPSPRASLDLAPLCTADSAMAVTGKLSTVMTVKEISNGPKLPGGMRLVEATDKLPAFCQVTGSFVTNPKTGKTANFLATLPANWNGKYLQLGCFGHCGFFALNDATSPLGTITSQGYPYESLIKGYASFATDEGHMGRGAGGWAVKSPGQINDDATADFFYRADQVLARAGKEFTVRFYASTPARAAKVSRSYFSGCSGGGRDALIAADYFPEEFDGIVAGSPYANMVGAAFQAAGGALAALRAEDADVLPELMSRMDPIVKAQCDKLDGVEDGLIQNPAACNFRPERDLPRCAGNSPNGECFTASQIQTVSALLTAVTDEHGEVVQPGYSVSELQYGLRRPTRPADLQALEPWPDGDTYASSAEGLWPLADATLKIFTHQADPSFHTRALFRFEDGGPGPVTAFRIVVPHAEVERAIMATHMGIGSAPENLAKLIKEDRKLLIWHNLSDQLLTPYRSINYYKALALHYGGYQKLQRNVRLFTIPDSSHCSMSGVGPDNFDALTAIEDWVEKSKAPDALLAKLYSPSSPTIDVTKTALRSMPLCKFPEMAHYQGSGDVKDAANWSCPAGDTSMLSVGESGRQSGVTD